MSGEDPDATRRIDPDAGREDPTRTQRIDRPGAPPGGAPQREPYEGVAYPPPGTGQPHDEAPGESPDDAGPSKRRGRDVGMVVLGIVLGFVIAFIVVALGTSDRDDPGAAAADERVEALESDLAEREARIAELEAQVDELQATVEGPSSDVESLQAALEERSAQLDERASALDERAAALEQREQQLEQRAAELDQREAALEDREAGEDAPAEETQGGDGGVEDLLPSEEEVDTFIDRVLDRIRDLF